MINRTVVSRFPKMDARSIAAKVLSKLIISKVALDKILPGFLKPIPDSRDRAFVQELCYGVLRWYPRLDLTLDKLLNKKIRKQDTDIRALMLCGIYQLDYMRTPDHAAIAATVKSANLLNKEWSGSMINAVLRRYQREHEQIQSSLQDTTSAKYAHPQWLIDEIRRDWPGHWELIAAGNNGYPPMHLRINRLQTTRENYLEELKNRGISGIESVVVESGLSLATPVTVEKLPGFETGRVSVQDCGAQLAAYLLDVEQGHRVLDTCASPGGKAGHILELQPNLQKLIALETGQERIQLLHDTKRRLNINIDIIHTDARNTDSWWDGLRFDRILLDVPCSATGVIRRHPDIKFLRQPDQIRQYVKIQGELLESVWPLLKPEGILLYTTCSLLRQENDMQIENFMKKYKDISLLKIDAGWGYATDYGRQTLPLNESTDGFYYAKLLKLPSIERQYDK